MKALKLIIGILLIVGGLNWGLVGAFDFNLVTAIFGDGTLSSIIYIIVGIAALVKIPCFIKCCSGSSCENK